MPAFLDALRSGRALLMDGGMGTELWKVGLREEEDGSDWNLQYPDRVRAIHQAYIDAGAEVLLTNTFQANPASFFLRGSPERLRDVWQAGVALARAAEPPPRYLLADIGAFEAGAEEKVRHLRDCRELIAALAHVDGLLAETWSDLPSLISLLEANDCVQPNGPWPVLVSVTYQRDAGGRLATQHGESPQFWARQISQQPSVVALGVNCGRDIGMAETIDIIKRYREFTGLPLFARPNAGTPTKTNGKWGFPQSAQGMVDELPALLDAGVRMIGGCCGTTPDYIAAFKPVVDQWNAPEKSRTL